MFSLVEAHTPWLPSSYQIMSPGLARSAFQHTVQCLAMESLCNGVSHQRCQTQVLGDQAQYVVLTAYPTHDGIQPWS